MRLIAFDFDGTLSDSEMTVLLAQQASVDDEVAAITERAMNDEMSYAESLRRRGDLLGGLTEDDAEAAYSGVRLRPGAGSVIDRLQSAGHHVAILTGGFERGVERALDRAGTRVDTVIANRLPIEQGQITGDVEGPLIDGTKDDVLERLTDDLDISPDRTVAVGDGANDLPMLEAAGLSIGYEPKDAVRPVCDTTVGSMTRLGETLEQRRILPTQE